ncbi:TBCC domain-containing protein 1 [Nematostella vectensis]|uniref:TBCC domain-containing protein 1 n=1 Tax=Nematostella vectensis TaxID=45351 RepID=UPI0020776D9E|nr:TBCC domain-containing protein 1 [Nematostella vectensis]
MDSTSVSLWVRAEPFDCGAIHVPLPPKLTLHNLHKLSIYSRSKGKAGYPKISFSLWKHVACNKLGLKEDQAWMYFETFDMLSDSSFKNTQLWAKQSSQCRTQAEIAQLRNQVSVHLLQFVIFLFIQQIHKISFKASLVSGAEEWPIHSRSPDLDHKGSVAVKSLDEHDHLTFVLHHLNEILELLMEPDSGGGDSAVTESHLTLEAVDALGFLFIGTTDGKKIQQLQDLSRLQSEVNRSGYSKLCRSFSFRQFQTWLRSTLQINPYGVSEVLSQGKHKGDQSILSLSDTFEELSIAKHSEQCASKESSIKGRIMTNVNFAPAVQRLVIMSQICKQTVAKASDTYAGSNLKIHRCHYSYIYVLCPLRSVTITKCHDSTIVLGCVNTAVNIIGCQNVLFIMISNQVSMSACLNCSFHLCTPTRPLILTGNEGLTLAPYHTFYPKLEEHLKSPWGVATFPNEWNNPLLLGNGHSEYLDDSSCPEVYREMPLEDFFTFNIPFNMKGSTDGSPIPLPEKYENALQDRENIISGWYQTVKDASLNKPQRAQLQGIVQKRFQDWLTESGNGSQLNGLVPPHSSKSSTSDHSKH